MECGWFARWGARAAVLGAALACADAFAVDGVVGPGNCNESGFNSVLSTVDGSGGGMITFNCGTATIGFSSYKQVSHTVTIDGGGTITIDGGNSSAFFQVFVSANLTLKNLTLQHGAFSVSHALENFGVLRLDRVRVVNNSSTETPLANYGSLSVNWSMFTGNAATSASLGEGGAIAHTGDSMTIKASTFADNSAGHYGGAIYSTAPFSIINSTFGGNNAGLGGGAIYQDGSGDSTLSYATVVGNSAVFGAGVYNEGSSIGTLTIAKSIISANSDGDCDGVLATGGYNLGSGTGCGGVFTGTGDLINQSLPMGALANNGGPTLTMLPQSGNPAINHVPSAACEIPTDQRGGGRPFGSGCDSGAVEVGATIDLVFYDGFD